MEQSILHSQTSKSNSGFSRNDSIINITTAYASQMIHIYCSLIPQLSYNWKINDTVPVTVVKSPLNPHILTVSNSWSLSGNLPQYMGEGYVSRPFGLSGF
jgi:hypothetical protein